MDIKNMAAVESRGTCNVIKKQYGKHEKFVGTLFLFFQKRKPVLKKKRGMKKEWLRKEGEKFGGEKKKK